MQVCMLGPLLIEDADGSTVIDGTKERALASVLALQVGAPVPASKLVDALWGDSPPETATKTLQSHVSRLRGLLGADVVRSEPGGYVLTLDPESVDAVRFERLIGLGGEALAVGDVVSAREALDAALGLWRGDPLVDLADGEFRRAQATRLGELHLLAIERSVAARLGLGEHAELVPILAQLVLEHPLHEQLWADLMLALYRCGRQADALRTYRRLRRVLGEELGIEPSPQLARLESQVLRQAEALDLDPPPPPTNLPATVSSFVGRDDDLRAVTELVGQHRLVTLVGPGGVGKTRLALEVARELDAVPSDGTWWIDLAAVRAPEAVVPRFAAVLNVASPVGATLEDGLVNFVRRRQLLLVVDNCEHLVDRTAALVSRLLEAGPDATVIATSRVPLRLSGEVRHAVTPLAVPPIETGELDLAAYDAVRLFADRAEESTGAPPTSSDNLVVADICRQLDGVPLAIELAAARCGHLGITGVHDRLGHRFDLLTGGSTTGEVRHRSLRAALDWSYELLSGQAQRLFDSLSVFPGSFDLDAAEAVAADVGTSAGVVDRLTELVDASMVEAIPLDSGRIRYRLLETMKEYGLDRLDDEGVGAARAAHANHYRAWAGRMVDDLSGAVGTRRVRSAIHLEDHNLRVALEWSFAHDDPAVTLELAPALLVNWYYLGYVAEAAALGHRVLPGTDGAPDLVRAAAVYSTVWPTFLSGEFERAMELDAEAIQCYRELGHSPGLAFAFHAHGHMINLATGDTDEALRWYEAALEVCADAGLTYDRGWPLTLAAQTLTMADRLDGVGDLIDEAQELFEDADDQYCLSHALMDRWLYRWAVDDIGGCRTAAEAMYRSSRAAHTSLYEQIASVGLGIADLYSDDPDAALVHLLRAVRLALDDGNLLQLGVALQATAALAARLDEPEIAARLYGASTHYAQLWPLMARRYEPMLAAARVELADTWDEEAAHGSELAPTEAVELAFGLTDTTSDTGTH